MLDRFPNTEPRWGTPRDLKALSKTALQMPLIKEQLSKVLDYSILLNNILYITLPPYKFFCCHFHYS